MLLTIQDVMACLQVGETRALRWLQGHGLKPSHDFGKGRGGGKRWRADDVNAAIDLDTTVTKYRARAKAKDDFFALPFAEAKKVLDKGKPK